MNNLILMIHEGGKERERRGGEAGREGGRGEGGGTFTHLHQMK